MSEFSNKQAACGGVFPCRQFLDLTGHPVQFIVRRGGMPVQRYGDVRFDLFHIVRY